MAQIFHRSMNSFAKVTIFGGVFIVAGLVWAASVVVNSSYVTRMDVVRDQPVPFSHDHHVSGLGLDCRYCHHSVEISPNAGMPSTEICMGCHSQIWNRSELLEPVRRSFRTGEPLQWTRVHDLPDFVYFNHSVHVARGIGCESCHGRVDRMHLMRKSASLHMVWCLECHRHPEAEVRLKADVFKFGQRDAHAEHVPHGEAGAVKPDSSGESLGERLVKEYKIAKHQITDCTVCHR